MSIRYLSNLRLAVLAALGVIASFAFAAETYAWLVLGGGAVAVVLGIASGAVASSKGQRALSATTIAIGAWAIVASAVFSEGTTTWLGFSAAVGLTVVAVAGLTPNELRDEQNLSAIDLRSADPTRAPPSSPPDRVQSRGRAGLRDPAPTFTSHQRKERP